MYIVSVAHNKYSNPTYFETLEEARNYIQEILDRSDQQGNYPYRINVSELVEGVTMSTSYSTKTPEEIWDEHKENQRKAFGDATKVQDADSEGQD